MIKYLHELSIHKMKQSCSKLIRNEHTNNVKLYSSSINNNLLDNFIPNFIHRHECLEKVGNQNSNFPFN
jgi:hypothetical protein